MRPQSTPHLGVKTIPSYSLLRIISMVCRKCFLLASTDAESCWFPARLEWMSSISPLRYLVVTCEDYESVKCVYYSGHPYSPIHYVGQSNKHIDRESPQTALSKSPSPCTNRPREEHAVDTLVHACHPDRAKSNPVSIVQLCCILIGRNSPLSLRLLHSLLLG